MSEENKEQLSLDMTPAEFEAAMVEADPLTQVVTEETPALQRDKLTQEIGQPEDIAAAMFQKHAVRLKQSLRFMSKNELIRIILHATLYPLYENRKIIKSEDEATVAYDIKELVRCMMIMEIAAANDARPDETPKASEGTDNGTNQTTV